MTHDPSPSSGPSTWTPFRQVEKHYKSRLIPHTTPSLHHPLCKGVIDLSRPLKVEEDEVCLSGWWGPGEDEGTVKWRRRKGKERARGERGADGSEGLKVLDLGGGTVGYIVANGADQEGCILIPRYLDPEEQLDLLKSALSEYTLPPNPLSLSTHYSLPSNLFNTYTSAPETIVPSIFTSLPPDEQAAIKEREAQGYDTRKINDTLPGGVVGYENILKSGKEWEGDKPGSRLGSKTVGELMKELRWANLGWVYRWTTKSYDLDTTEPIPFPAELADTCTNIVRRIPWDQVHDHDKHQAQEPSQTGWQTWKDDYRPDSGIVNFYQLKDTLMGHADRAELDPSRPLISISLGHSAIFLLGSTTRETAPRPIILRSGDVLIMSGKGRQAYHGVPRIMEGTLPSHFSRQDGDSEKIRAVKQYISSARVNINARQVFPPGFKFKR